MIKFNIKQPTIKDPNDIEKMSLETISSEIRNYPKFQNFTPDQQKIIQRMIHTTTCFEQIIDNITFSEAATDRIKKFLLNGASIISDTNMIKAGLSSIYTDKYRNKTVCYVAEADIKETARREGTTRTIAAVKKALKSLKNIPVILACGNAPTFLYAAIENFIKNDWDLNNVAILVMPVGFINVVESKEYTYNFINKTKAEGITLHGRYGGSPLVVSCLHALYKLI